MSSSLPDVKLPSSASHAHRRGASNTPRQLRELVADNKEASPGAPPPWVHELRRDKRRSFSEGDSFVLNGAAAADPVPEPAERERGRNSDATAATGGVALRKHQSERCMTMDVSDATA
eukprot:CAMPEP_0118863324 /NCGR_PEP_ID=MMETSP1163-20130328/8241_1 /TAXON_ID=124430 /ORGANISM="Phaeomonas parva, Strain CCMP2877" /LENGTH=117 /DNA_ID=CAMNT_0006797319 /DNA_START=82 /DNA_END=431 /DNA_ORIENTATION=+